MKKDEAVAPSDKIPEDSVRKILEATRWAPSGSNMQPWDILVVCERDGRAKLVEILEKMIKIDWANEQATADGKAFPVGGLGYTKRSKLLTLEETEEMKSDPKKLALEIYGTASSS